MQWVVRSVGVEALEGKTQSQHRGIEGAALLVRNLPGLNSSRHELQGAPDLIFGRLQRETPLDERATFATGAPIALSPALGRGILGHTATIDAAAPVDQQPAFVGLAAVRFRNPKVGDGHDSICYGPDLPAT